MREISSFLQKLSHSSICKMFETYLTNPIILLHENWLFIRLPCLEGATRGTPFSINNSSFQLFPGVMLVAIQSLGPISSAVSTFNGYKLTLTQAKYIYKVSLKKVMLFNILNIFFVRESKFSRYGTSPVVNETCFSKISFYPSKL